MLGNLKTPPEPFRDVILTHFRLKANSITKQLDEWLKLDDGKALSGHGAAYVHGGAGTTPANASGAGSGYVVSVYRLARLRLTVCLLVYQAKG